MGCLLAWRPGSVAASEIVNGGFEQGLEGWRGFWSRDAGTGGVTIESGTRHSGQFAARIEQRGQRDWSFEPVRRLDVQAGDLFEYAGWVQRLGAGDLTLCVSTWGADGQVREWSYASRQPRDGDGWQRVVTRFVAPPGIVQIQPRIIGNGPGLFLVDDVSIERKAARALTRRADLPATLTLSNACLGLVFDTAEGTLAVTDRRTWRTWRQASLDPNLELRDAAAEPGGLRLDLVDVSFGLECVARLRMDEDTPELTLTLSAAGEMPQALAYPPPFQTARGDSLVIPMNEGISYPVEDTGIDPMRLIAYGGHGICMAFWGVSDGQAGQMAIIETPDDAAIRLRRVDQRLVVAPEWDPQRQQFGYERRLRFVFLERGGHVAMAKRYRQYARQRGLLKTLAEKRADNPSVDLLVGAVNVWCWDKDAVSLVDELRAAGIERILWSNAQPPESLRALNGRDVLTSRYDIYQDVMDPTHFPRLRWIHPDWTTGGWPADLITDAQGHWRKGWEVETKDGGMVPCGVLCDRRALAYARERIPMELATHPYRCRFLDTTTASPWNECYGSNHPMSRTESRQAKMELLRYVAEECRLVTGSETGHDAAAPYVHYFEGMLSLGPYRVPDAGRRMNVLWTNVPERVARFQVGHAYRLPLWELVYHDCVVAQWYWGDYNNKLPALWTRRDLFNVLYGTPPMFMFDRGLWRREQARFVQSYRDTCPLVRRVGYAEMTDHRFLTPDRRVQQTHFANGVTVTVNFGDAPFRLNERVQLPALGYHVSE